MAVAAGQISLYGHQAAGILPPAAPVSADAAARAGLCTGCRQRQARYGFRGQRGAGRPGTLCFQCFRSELGRRQEVAERMRRGWNGVQAGLPLADTLAARGGSPAAFDRRGIPPGGVAPPSNIPDMLGRRALPGGRRTHLGATRDSHPGLLEALRTRRRRAQIAARHALEGTTPPPRVSATRPKAS